MATVEEGFNLYVHQRLVVDWLVQNRFKSLLLAHGMGTGKTRTAVAAMAACGQPFVVIAPLATHRQWRNEIAKLASLGLAELAYREILNAKGLAALFTNPGRKAERQRLFDFLRKGATLILDEAHSYKTMAFDAGPKSKEADEKWRKARLESFIEPPPAAELWRFSKITVQAVCELADRACRVVALTGTPMVNAPSDFAIYFRLCLNQPLAKPLFYFTPSQFNALFVGTPAKLARFKELACHMVSVYEVSDADKRANYEWPYQFDAQTIPIQLQPLEMQQLEQRPPGMYQALKRQLTVASKIQAPEFLAAMQFIVEDVRKNNTQRYAIYSNFIEKGLKVIEKMLEDIPFSKITGDTADSQEQQAAYNAGTTNVILLSPAAQEGVDLKNTDVLFIMDLNWSKAQQDQIRARVFRNQSHVTKTYPFNREVIANGRCGRGWLLLTTFPDPASGRRLRARYRANMIPKDVEFEFVQFVGDQTVIVKTVLLMTPAQGVGGSDESMIGLQERKNLLIQPYLKALNEVCIENKPHCIALPALIVAEMTSPPKASDMIYMDLYPSGQDVESPCYQAPLAVPQPGPQQLPAPPPPLPGVKCRVTPTANDGNCFFDATSIATGRQVSIAELRRIVANATNNDVIRQYKQDLQLKRELKKDKIDIDKMTLAQIQLAIATDKHWWADQFAVETVSRKLGVLFYIVDVSREAVERVKVHPYDHYSTGYVYDQVIPLWYSGRHYENIDCGGRKYFERDNLPVSVIEGIGLVVRSTVRYAANPADTYIIVDRRWSAVTKQDALPQMIAVDILNLVRYNQIVNEHRNYHIATGRYKSTNIIDDARNNRHKRRVRPTEINVI